MVRDGAWSRQHSPTEHSSPQFIGNTCTNEELGPNQSSCPRHEPPYTKPNSDLAPSTLEPVELTRSIEHLPLVDLPSCPV